MPRSLAIETSGRLGSIALAEDGRLIDQAAFPHGLKHAAGMLPMIDELCRQHHWTPADLRHLYVSAGPGSFTGLRIGITLAKTLAFATGAAIVAVPSVRVLVRNAPPEARQVVIVLDAKRDQIFTARFERTDAGWTEREPAHLDTLSAVLARIPRPVHLLGEGLPQHRKFIAPDDVQVIVTAEPSWQAQAAAVVEVGAQMAMQGELADAMTLAPIYIRMPEAEEKYLAGLLPVNK